MLSLLFISLSLIGHAFAYSPQNGDIIFHISKSSQSKAIQIATKSPYSHVGIVYIKDGKPYVYAYLKGIPDSHEKLDQQRRKQRLYRNASQTEPF